MGAGLPSSWTMEIEFTAGVWTDVTASVNMKVGIGVAQGRATPYDQIQAGSLTFTLDNPADPVTGICKFTPDNPLSAYYPNLVEGKRVRYKVIRSATTYQRFQGWITSINPVMDALLKDASVAITAVDALGQFGNITMRSDYTNVILFENPTLGADVFPFNETGTPASCANIGRTAATPGNAALIVRPGRGSSITFGTDPALNLEGVITTTANNPGVGVTSATSFGPILLLNCDYPTSVGFWMKTTVAGSGSLSTGTYHLFGGGFDPSAYIIGLVPNGTDLNPSFFGGAAGSAIVANDGAWHSYQIQDDGAGNWNCWVDDVSAGSVAKSVSGPGICWLGGMYTNRNSTGYCLPSASWAGWFLEYDHAFTYRAYALPNQTVIGYNRLAELALQSPLGLTPGLTGADARVVIRKPTAGVNLLTAVAELALTLGAPIFCSPDGTPQIRTPDATRLTTLVATITMGSDDDNSGGFATTRAAASIPTRATVNSPTGDVTVVNKAAEAGGVQRPVSLTTCAATLLDAANVGNAQLTAAGRLRVAAFSVDLVTAENDLYAAFLGFATLVPGCRFRLLFDAATAPAFGFTYFDVYVQGWKEKLTDSSYVFTFDSSPADAPPDGIFDDATYGRFATDGATVTGGTCVGNTGTGTLIVTTTNGSSPVWTTTPGDYPMDLDWNGERVTVSGVGGGTSPQTFTVTARGVGPSIARVHASGEPVDCYLAACFAL